MSLIVQDTHFTPSVEKAKAAGQTATGQPGDIVRAVNRDNVTYRLPWDSNPHLLPPNQDIFIPWEVMAVHFGDPRSLTTAQSVRDAKGIVSWLPDRAIERRRVLQKWDFDNLESANLCHRVPDALDQYGNPDSTPTCVNKCKHTRGELVGEIKRHGIPNIEFYALDGTRILTVADDPMGDHVNTAAQTVSQQSGTSAQLETMAKELAALKQMMGAQQQAASENLGEAPVAGPEPVPVQTGVGGTTEVIQQAPDEPEPPDDLPEDSH